MLTLNELQERLKQIDEVTLMELLEITSEDITEKFLDKIEDRYDYLIGEITEISHGYEMSSDMTEGNEWWEKNNESE